MQYELLKEEDNMVVYQLIDDCAMEEHVYGTKEAVALRLLEIVMKAKEGSVLNDLLRVYELEVR
jgi:hypothetical protein